MVESLILPVTACIDLSFKERVWIVSFCYWDQVKSPQHQDEDDGRLRPLVSKKLEIQPLLKFIAAPLFWRIFARVSTV